MIDPPKIITTPHQLTAVIHVTVPREQIRSVMGPGLGELISTLASQGISPTGPWFTHHRKTDPAIFDFEISVPVATAAQPAGRVQPSQLPATKVARTIYHGPYENLGAAWDEFEKWLAASGLKTAPNLWECYLAGPEASSDPAQWRTELNRPLID